MANTIFGQVEIDILPAFRDTLINHFGASIQLTDFSENQVAATMINKWVERVTREKIRDIIQPDLLDPLTKLVLVNAIYFMGEWSNKFNIRNTENLDFHLVDGSSVSAPMMSHTKNYQVAKIKNLDAAMIELPYKGERIVMQILLPKKTGGLRELEGKLKAEDLEDLFQEKKKEMKVELFLPRFKLEQTIPLASCLKQLGMENMFVEGQADFCGIDGSKDLFISAVIQKAAIVVTEEGSEAAAATGKVKCGCLPPKEVPAMEFRIDHPFLFFLRDSLTGMMLFQGRVENPTV